MTDTAPRTLVNCGHVAESDGFTTGYGTLDGYTQCFACIAQDEPVRMRYADRWPAYVSADGRRIVGWPGHELGRVVSLTTSRAARKTYVRMIDRDGRPWSGVGPAESGTYVNLRRVKA